MRNKALIKIAITALLAVMVAIPAAAAAGEAMISLGVYQDPAKGSLQLTAVLAVPAGTNPKLSDFTFALTDPAGQMRSLPAPTNFYWRAASQTATFEFFTLPADLFNQTVTIQVGYGGSTREVTVTLRPSGSTGSSLLGVASVNTDGRGELTVVLNGLPRREPTSGDFTVTHTINGVPVPAAPVLGVALTSWDRATRTAVLTVPVVTPDPELDQIVVYYVAFNNTAAVKAPPVPVQAAPPAGSEPLRLLGVTLNPDNTLALTLNKYPGALWPTGYFSVRRSINGFFPAPLPAEALQLLSLSEASGTPVAVLAMPPLPSYPSRQKVFVTVSSPLGRDSCTAMAVVNRGEIKVTPAAIQVYELEETHLNLQVVAGGLDVPDVTFTLIAKHPELFSTIETVAGSTGRVQGLKAGNGTLMVSAAKAGMYLTAVQVPVTVLPARLPEITGIPAGSVFNDEITVRFSRYPGEVSPEDFVITPLLHVTGAKLQADRQSVVLTTEFQVPGTIYTLTFKGRRTALFTGAATSREPRIEEILVLSSTGLQVAFNQPVATVTPGDFTGFSATGYFRIFDATLLSGARSALLTVEPLTAGTPYVLTYRGQSLAFAGPGLPVKVTVDPAGSTQSSLQVNFDSPVTGAKPADFKFTPDLAVFQVLPGPGGFSALLITDKQVAGLPYLLKYTGAAEPVAFLGVATPAVNVANVVPAATLGEFTFTTSSGVAQETLDGLTVESALASHPIQVTALNREGTAWRAVVAGVRYGTSYRLTAIAPLIVLHGDLVWNGIAVTRLEPLDPGDPAKGIRLDTDRPVTVTELAAEISLAAGPACSWKQSDYTGQVFLLVPDPPAAENPADGFVKGQTYTLTIKQDSRFFLQAGLALHVIWPWP